jgi:prepilin-type N-terminal cleavage/methylation domain-containing protein
MGKIPVIKNQKGFSLIDILVSLALISIISVGAFSAMAGAAHTTAKTDEIDTARLIAQAQMENIKKQPFNASGEYTIDEQFLEPYQDQGYSVPAPDVQNAQERDGLIQRITVNIYRFGDPTPIYTLEDCKTK